MPFNSRRQRNTQVRKPSSPSTDNIFLRSRTLTGSVSSRVIATVEHVSQLKSPRLEEHELRGHRRKLMTLLIINIIFASGIAWIIDSSIVSIHPETGSEANTRYIQLVNNYLQYHPLQRLSFVLDQQRLTSVVQSNAPEVLSVGINGDGMYASHTVSVILRTPIAQWKIGTDVYLVDAEGVAYQHGNVSTVGLLQVKDESGLPLASQKVASRKTMQFIGRVVAQLKSQGAGKVVEVILPVNMLKEIDVVMESRPYRIKLQTDRDPTEQATDVVHTLRYIDEKGIIPAYIDARVEGKAFYR